MATADSLAHAPGCSSGLRQRSADADLTGALGGGELAVRDLGVPAARLLDGGLALCVRHRRYLAARGVVRAEAVQPLVDVRRRQRGSGAKAGRGGLAEDDASRPADGRVG